MEEYAATPDAPRRLRPHTGLAWLFIILFVLVSLILPRLPQREARPAAADGGVMMEAQAKLLAGGAALGNGRPPRMYLDQAEAMSTMARWR